MAQGEAAATRLPLEVVVSSRSMEEDEDRVLREMGYKHELRRGLTALSSFSFCYTSVAVLASLSILYNYGLRTGGPAVMVWGWVLTSVMTVMAGAALGEICSTYPTAGSVYHWAAEMDSGPFWSFVTAWFNFFGNCASTVSTAYGFAQVMSAARAIDGEGFTKYEQVALAMGAVVAWTVMNALKIQEQGRINNFSTLWQVSSTLMIVVAVLAMPSQRNSTADVFLSTNSDIGLPPSAFPYVALLGLLSSTFALAGYESAAHVAEETTHASVNAPLAIVNTCITASVMGFLYLLGLLYATTDRDSAARSDNGAVWTFVASCGPRVGRMLTGLLGSNLFLAGIAAVTATSRIGYAMARDGLLPGSAYLSQVQQGSKVPLRMVVLSSCLSLVFLLLPLITELAFEAFTSIDTIGYQISYAIPIILRIRQGDNFRRGPFHLGRYSIPVAMVAAGYLVLTSVIFFWPAEFPVTPKNMNYTCLVLGAASLAAGLYWWLFARQHFHAPKKLEGHGGAREAGEAKFES